MMLNCTPAQWERLKAIWTAERKKIPAHYWPKPTRSMGRPVLFGAGPPPPPSANFAASQALTQDGV